MYARAKLQGSWNMRFLITNLWSTDLTVIFALKFVFHMIFIYFALSFFFYIHYNPLIIHIQHVLAPKKLD